MNGEEGYLTGIIVHGKGLGRTVGMPTANLQWDAGSVLPETGVYASLLEADGQTYFGVTNVGMRPSVDSDPTPTVETFLLDFNGDLYNRRVRLRLKAYLRPVRKMASLDDVRAQVQADSVRAREILSEIASDAVECRPSSSDGECSPENTEVMSS